MKRKNSAIFVLSVVLIFSSLVSSFAQDAGEDEIQSPYMEFKYLKDTQGQRILDAKIFLAGELGLIPLEGLTVSFYTNMDEPELLGEAVTDSRGIARYIIPDSLILPLDEDNNWWFFAEFAGNERYEMTMEEISLMDVNLSMSLEETEDGKMIYLEAYIMQNGEKMPVSDEDIFIFVPRMFSLLQVAEGYFIDGEAEVEFPDNVPGDGDGNLTVIGRFNDHWQFANVEKRIESHRALWTQIAPRWMIVTLSIMLAGVWGHYLYAIISMIRIKRIEKKKNK